MQQLLIFSEISTTQENPHVSSAGEIFFNLLYYKYNHNIHQNKDTDKADGETGSRDGQQFNIQEAVLHPGQDKTHRPEVSGGLSYPKEKRFIKGLVGEFIGSLIGWSVSRSGEPGCERS